MARILAQALMDRTTTLTLTLLIKIETREEEEIQIRMVHQWDSTLP